MNLFDKHADHFANRIPLENLVELNEDLKEVNYEPLSMLDRFHYVVKTMCDDRVYEETNK